MPAGYSVVVLGSRWPTMQALQECLDHHGWPVKLGDSTHPQWSEPLETVRYTLGIPVVFKGEPIELEAEIATLDYTNMPETNRQLSVFGATHVLLENGDWVLTVWLRVNIKEHQAAFYVMAALIKHFDGYGFGEGGGHGTSSYADLLLAEAKRLEVEGPRQTTPQEAAREGGGNAPGFGCLESIGKEAHARLTFGPIWSGQSWRAMPPHWRHVWGRARNDRRRARDRANLPHPPQCPSRPSPYVCCGSRRC